MSSPLHIFLVFLRLGLTSFGGPVAHLGYFRDEFVHRRRWLGEEAYADIVALSQFLPGPSSSQVGMAIGLVRGGIVGLIAAWTGFTLPSALLMAGAGYGIIQFDGAMIPGLLAGLKIVAVAVVAQAVWGMATQLCPDSRRRSLAIVAAVVMLVLPGVPAQLGVIIGGAILGALLLADDKGSGGEPLDIAVPRLVSVFCLGLFFLLLFGLPLMVLGATGGVLVPLESFYRAGSLVFGGGHVVLPLLQGQMVPNEWVSNDAFLAGYGLAQAVPGPLFTFAAYLGFVMDTALSGWSGAVLCLLAVFAPSFLLLFGVLPFWELLRRQQQMRRAMLGINAAVVGLLFAALYDPVFVSAIHGPVSLALGLIAFAMLSFWRLPAWLVVVLTAAGSTIISLVSAGSVFV